LYKVKGAPPAKKTICMAFEQTVTAPSEFTRKRCILNENTVSNVHSTYGFFLEYGVHLNANAKSAGHHTVNPLSYDPIWGLQMIILAMNDGDEGADYINVDKSRKRKYQQVLDAIVRRIVGKPKPQDNKFLKQMIIGTSYFSVEQQQDIKNALLDYQEAERKKSEKGSKNTAPEEEEEPRAKRRAIQSTILSRLPDILDSDIPGQMLLPEPDPEPEPEQEPEIEQEHLADGEGFDEIMEDNDLSTLGRSLGDFPHSMLQKHKLTVCELFSDDGIAKGVLYIVTVFDTTWNPGNVQYKIQGEDTKRRNPEANRFHVDSYGDYAKFYGSLFPVYNNSRSMLTAMCNRISGETPTKSRLQNQAGMRLDVFESEMHMSQMFSLEKALENARIAGASPSMVGQINYHEKTVSWPSDITVYEYLPSQVFWYHPEKCGLSEVCLPFISMENKVLATLNNQTVDDRLKLLSETTPVLTRKQVLDLLPRVDGIPTTNIILLTNADAKNTMRKIEAEKPHHFEETIQNYVQQLPVNDVLMQECVKYSGQMEMARKHYMKQFNNICRLDGNVEYIDMPDSLKGTLTEFAERFSGSKFPQETRLYDTSISIFGNSVIKHQLLLEKVFCVIHCFMPMKVEATNVVFMLRNGLIFNYGVNGDKDGGKSFSAITAAQFQMMESTYTNVAYESDKNDVIDMDRGPIVAFYDEGVEIVVNPKAAQKNAEKANRKKSILTSGTVEASVFEMVKIPGTNRTMRSNRPIRARRNVAEVFTTNFVVEKGTHSTAMISRYHCDTMKVSSKPIDQYNYYVPACEKRDGQNYFYSKQFLYIWAEQAITCGAIADVNMELWDEIGKNMMAVLRTNHILEAAGDRSMKKMKRMARYQVVIKGIVECFLTPGGACYGQEFHPEMFTELQRYLYATEDVCLYVWTMMSSEWIDEDCINVLQAACKYLGADLTEDDNMYDMFAGSKPGSDSFRLQFNDKWAKDNGVQTKEFIDLNYLQIKGSLDEVAAKISQHTSPHMPTSMVKNVLEMLSKRQFKPARNYTPMSPQDLNNHKCQVIEKKLLVKNMIETTIRTKEQELGYSRERLRQMHLEHRQRNIDEIPAADIARIHDSLFIGSSSIKEFADELSISLEHSYFLLTHHGWELTQYRKNEISRQTLIGNVPDDFNCDLTAEFNIKYDEAFFILKMFENQSVWAYGTPKTYVKPNDRGDGVMLSEADIPRQDTHIFAVMINNTIRTRKKVSFAPAAMKLYDSQAILEAFVEVIMCSSTKPGKRLLGWTHPEDCSKFRTVEWSQEFIDTTVTYLDEQKAPGSVPRTRGVVFNRRGFRQPGISDMFTVEKRQYSMSSHNPIELVKNLDDWSALKQHMKCPDPFKEPVRTQAFIANRYNKRDMGHGSMNYPESLIKNTNSVRDNQWYANGAEGMRNNTRQGLREIMKKFKK